MKAIMLSVQSKWLAKILKGEKDKEVRTTVPKDFVGWVYLYCTKKLSGRYIVKKGEDFYGEPLDKPLIIHIPTFFEFESGGKVLARFWFDEYSKWSIEKHDDKILTMKLVENMVEYTKNSHDNLLKNSCLTINELWEYAKPSSKLQRWVYAWHIDNLVVFDKPKELREFGLTKAPQSWQYVEVKEDE